VACSRRASKAIFAFSVESIFRLIFFVIARSVYRTELPISNLAHGPKNGVHFKKHGPAPGCLDVEAGELQRYRKSCPRERALGLVLR